MNESKYYLFITITLDSYFCTAIGITPDENNCKTVINLLTFVQYTTITYNSLTIFIL
jgi:hypothetical protein